MGIDRDGTEINHHWNYFLTLEDDAVRLSRYVEFHEFNYCTFSIELAHLLFAASSEYEVVGKLLANKLDPNKESKKSFGKVIAARYPAIVRESIFVTKHGLLLNTPLEKIRNGPDWWQAEDTREGL